MLILFTPELNWELGGKVSCHCQQGAESGICQSLLKLSFTYDMHMPCTIIDNCDVGHIVASVLPHKYKIEASLVGILVVKSCRDWFENSRNVFEMFTVRSFSACWILNMQI